MRSVEQSAVPGLCPLGCGNGTSILVNEENLCEKRFGMTAPVSGKVARWNWRFVLRLQGTNKCKTLNL